MKMTAEQLCKRQASLKSARGTIENHWQEVIDYTMPNLRSVIREETKGAKKGALLFDNTAMVSCEMLTSALHGTLTNPNVTWFELQPSKIELRDDEEVGEYLQTLTETLHGILNNSNFQTEVHQFYLDLVTIGTAIMSAEADEERIVRFSTRHISECVIAENNKHVVQELYREFKWTASQIIQEFARDAFGNKINVEEMLKTDRKSLEDKFSSAVIEAFENNKSIEFTIIHGVYKEKLLEDAGKPFVSHYVLKGKEKKDLRIKGFKRFPYVVARWIKNSNEVYGRSPAMTALPEAKTVNQMVKALVKAAQKIVDPPVQMPDDGFIKPTKTAPGSIHYYRAGTTDRVEPIFKSINPGISEALIRDRQVQIREAFYVDKLSLLQGDRMTTVEVNQRIEEQLRFLAPMLGRQRTEFLIPGMDLVIDIAVEADGGTGKILGQVPAQLFDTDLRAEYTSPIARAQIITQGQNMVRALEASAQFIQLDNKAADIINAEQAVKMNWNIYGAPKKVLRSAKEIQAIQDARAQAQQQILEQQQNMSTAEQANKLAPVLKE